jgi:hypothetical protein
MKKEIEGIVYDLGTAELIGSKSIEEQLSHDRYEEFLYKNKTGHYFLSREIGIPKALGIIIKPLNDDQIKEWLKEPGVTLKEDLVKQKEEIKKIYEETAQKLIPKLDNMLKQVEELKKRKFPNENNTFPPKTK